MHLEIQKMNFVQFMCLLAKLFVVIVWSGDFVNVVSHLLIEISY